MGTATTVRYAVRCECGHRTEQTIAWLTVHNNMSCGGCGAVINLESGENAIVIDKLSQQCADIDALRAKRQ